MIISQMLPNCLPKIPERHTHLPIRPARQLGERWSSPGPHQHWALSTFTMFANLLLRKCFIFVLIFKKLDQLYLDPSPILGFCIRFHSRRGSVAQWMKMSDWIEGKTVSPETQLPKLRADFLPGGVFQPMLRLGNSRYTQFRAPGADSGFGKDVLTLHGSVFSPVRWRY